MSGIIKQIRRLLQLKDILDSDFVGKDGFILVVNEANGYMELQASASGGIPLFYGMALSDETSDLVEDPTYSNPPALTDYASFNATISEVMFNVITPPDGQVITFDVHINGVSMFSTPPTIDELENTTVTAAVQQVISNPNIVKGDKIEIYIVTTGTVTKGTGAKAKMIGLVA